MNRELFIMMFISGAMLFLSLVVRKIEEKTNSLMMQQELLHKMIKINHEMINNIIKMMKTQYKMIDEIVEKKQNKETRAK